MKIKLFYTGITLLLIGACYWSFKIHHGPIYIYNIIPLPEQPVKPKTYYVSWDTTKTPPWRENIKK